MTRATTPKHTFIFEVDPERTFEKILITYCQNGKIVLEKQKTDLEFEPTTTCCGETAFAASCRLTQEETKRFASSEKGVVSVQVRVLTNEGEALASAERKFSVRDVLNDEVLQ